MMTMTMTMTSTNRRSSPRRWVLCGLLVVLCSTFRSSEAFVPVSHEPSRNACARAPLRVTSDEDPSASASASISISISASASISMEDLHDMDVVVYSLNDDGDNRAEGNDSCSDTPPTLYLGALQEDGILSPLSAWTDEPAFDDSIECLVDDVDRFSLKGVDAASGGVTIYHLLSEEEVSYGSRQCPRGPHNPHGEESELLYYVDKPAVLERFRIALAIKPELETLW